MIHHTQSAPARRPPAASYLEASFQGPAFSAFPDSIGGVILARLSDGWSHYFTRGGETQAFYRGVYTAIDGREAFESEGEAFDRAAAEYEGLMDAPRNMRGQPDESGMFWSWTAPDRRAA